jgi:hypothetical protein
MEKSICKKCGKEIEGFTKKDLAYKQVMHSLRHREENKKEEEVNYNRTSEGGK